MLFRSKPSADPEAQAVLQASLAETQRRAQRDQADIGLKREDMQRKSNESMRDDEIRVAMNAENNLTDERMKTLDLTVEAEKLKREQGESAIALQQAVQRDLKGD